MAVELELLKEQHEKLVAEHWSQREERLRADEALAKALQDLEESKKKKRELSLLQERRALAAVQERARLDQEARDVLKSREEIRDLRQQVFSLVKTIKEADNTVQIRVKQAVAELKEDYKRRYQQQKDEDHQEALRADAEQEALNAQILEKEAELAELRKKELEERTRTAALRRRLALAKISRAAAVWMGECRAAKEADKARREEAAELRRMARAKEDWDQQVVQRSLDLAKELKAEAFRHKQTRDEWAATLAEIAAEVRAVKERTAKTKEKLLQKAALAESVSIVAVSEAERAVQHAEAALGSPRYAGARRRRDIRGMVPGLSGINPEEKDEDEDDIQALLRRGEEVLNGGFGGSPVPKPVIEGSLRGVQERLRVVDPPLAISGASQEETEQLFQSLQELGPDEFLARLGKEASTSAVAKAPRTPPKIGPPK